MDSQYWLLHILMQVKLITDMQRRCVLERSRNNQEGDKYSKQNDTLIKFLIQCIDNDSKFSTYLKPLQATSQLHVENYIDHDGSKWHCRLTFVSIKNYVVPVTE